MRYRGEHVRGLDVARAREVAQRSRAQGSSSHPLHLVVAASSIVLVTVTQLAGGPIPRLITLAPFLLCIAWSLPRQRPGLLSSAAVVTLGLYLLTLLIELIRAAHGGFAGLGGSQALGLALAFVVIPVFGTTLVTSARNARELRSRLIAVALSPAVYVAVNLVLLQIVGEPANEFTRIAQGTPAEMLGLIGISATRVLFPLSRGVNYFGAVAAAGLASSVLMLARNVVDRRAAAVAAAVCAGGLLATDSRGALLIAVGVILAFVLATRIRASRGIAVILPVAPVAIAIILGIVANSGSAFGRSGSVVSSTSTRLQMWHSALGVLSHPSLNQIIGYGANGQITSGASLHYAYLFTYLEAPASVPVHSLLLQTGLDAGYIGLLALAAVFGVAAVRLERAGRTRTRTAIPSLLAILVILFLNGATEALPTYLAPDTLALALLVIGAAAALGPTHDRFPSRLRRERAVRQARDLPTVPAADPYLGAR